MPRTLKYRDQEATSGGEQALQYQALLDKLKPKMDQSPAECCEKPENQIRVGGYEIGQVTRRVWHGRQHHIEECKVCGRVHVLPAHLKA